MRRTRGNKWRAATVFHSSPTRGRRERSSGGIELTQRFEDVALPHIDAAYNVARYLVRDATAADDVVQEAYLRALRGFANYRGGDAKAWLLAIVRNCAYTWLAAHRADRADATIDIEALDDPFGETPEQAASRRSDANALQALIERLPEPYRETLVLRELEELSYKEIAQVTGVPIGTVMSRLARARQWLIDATERT
ncbi:MAG TPA: sigma-70 family RNA polymerase sigma factor [Pseudomonadales bacterium]|nr:sigma-70 family RNA polymerase sigma factor [Pseudomonadales bacterium]